MYRITHHTLTFTKSRRLVSTHTLKITFPPTIIYIFINSNTHSLNSSVYTQCFTQTRTQAQTLASITWGESLAPISKSAVGLGSLVLSLEKMCFQGFPHPLVAGCLQKNHEGKTSVNMCRYVPSLRKEGNRRVQSLP